MNSEKIFVHARLKPTCERNVWRVSNGKRSVSLESGKEYTLDNVFLPETTNEEVYTHIQPTISMVLSGRNCAIMAYGQTGAGKTFSVMGLLSNVFNDITNRIRVDEDREYSVKVSYIEVYNEIIQDLLFSLNESKDVNVKVSNNNTRKRPKLKICDHPIRGVVINGVTEIEVTKSNDFMNLLQFGEKKRHYGKTKMNDKSSRSHTIYMIVVESRRRKLRKSVALDDFEDDDISSGLGFLDEEEEDDEDENRKLVSSLSIVDLAGSEKQKRSNTSAMRFTEGCYINKSLLALTMVIQKLSEQSSVTSMNQNTPSSSSSSSSRLLHIPYRDSKLTRILKPALGNNSMCSIICCIDPRESSVEESISTLKFACRATKIRSKVKVNEVFDFKTAREKKYFLKIKKLQQIIKNHNSNNIITPHQQSSSKFIKPNFIEEEEQSKIINFEHKETNTMNNNRYDDDREFLEEEIGKFQRLAEDRNAEIIEKQELEKKVSLLEGEKIFMEFRVKMLEDENESIRSKLEDEKSNRRRVENLYNQQQQNMNHRQENIHPMRIDSNQNQRQNNIQIKYEEEEEGKKVGVKRKRDAQEDQLNFDNEYSKFIVTKKRKTE